MLRLAPLRRVHVSARRYQSALEERFQQILEDKLSQPQQKSLVDENPELAKLYRQYSTENTEDAEYKRKYKAQLALLERELLLNGNNHAKDIADTITKSPWKGTESTADVHNRMLLDLLPPAKPINGHNRIMSPPRDPKARVAAARESSIDYKTGTYKEEDDNFRELYKERLMGPSMFVNSNSPTATMGMAQTMADVRINATINRKTGQFDSPDMSSVRGKPLNPEHLANATDSNYFVNQILNKQEVLPPWIENQQLLEKDIKRFRSGLDDLWTKHVFSKLNPGSNSKLDVLARAKPIAAAPYDQEFATSNSSYVNEKVKHINDAIRSYNLMCPSPHLHKFKLLPEQELRNLFQRAMQNLEQSVELWYEREARAREVRERMNNSRSMFLLFNNSPAVSSTGTSTSTTATTRANEQPNQPLHFWKSIKEMMRS